jgi:hypothetical protein
LFRGLELSPVLEEKTQEMGAGGGEERGAQHLGSSRVGSQGKKPLKRKRDRKVRLRRKGCVDRKGSRSQTGVWRGEQKGPREEK